MTQPVSFRFLAIVTLAGVACSRLLEPLAFPLEWVGFRLSLGHLALVVLTMAATPLYVRPAPPLFWWLLGIVCDQAVFFIVAQRGLTFHSPPSLIGSAMLCTLLLISLRILAGRRAKKTSATPASPEIRHGTRYVILAGVVTVVALLHVVHLVSVEAGIPNEDRSLMVFKYEVHHINLGVLLVWATALLRGGWLRSRTATLLTMAMLTIGLGLVADQFSFYALRDVVDSAYHGRISLLGAFLGIALIAVTLPRVQTRRSEPFQSGLPLKTFGHGKAGNRNAVEAVETRTR